MDKMEFMVIHGFKWIMEKDTCKGLKNEEKTQRAEQQSKLEAIAII